MQQINLYIVELLETMRTAMAARGTAVQIWNHYWVRLEKGGTLSVLKDRLTELGKMQISEAGEEVFFSKLLTADGFEKQGIGNLVVTLGILYAIVKGARILRLGETDTNAVKGGHFWTSLGLSEGYAGVHETLRKMLVVQADTARKLGVVIDPNAILVAANPIRIGGGGTGTKTESKRRRSLGS